MTPTTSRLSSRAVAGVRSGLATVFVVGSTAAVTTIEFEPGAIEDLNAVFERLAPRSGDYRHHEKALGSGQEVRAGRRPPSFAVADSSNS